MDSKTAVRLITIFIYVIQQTTAQSCGGSAAVQPGQTYYVYSPNYPQSYGRGLTCSWIVTCPLNYNCVIECFTELPQSNNCVMDRVLISRSGDPNFIGADVYCGTGTFNMRSTSNRLSVALLTSQTSTGGRFYCELYAQPATPTCSCGWRKSNRIVGGVETERNEFPLMAGLRDLRIFEIKCGATIISSRYVLTAAHCLIGHLVNTFNVVVGAHAISDTTQVYSCQWFKMHEQFNSNTYNNDIALIYTASNIIFSDTVGPACLPFKYSAASFAGAQATFLGWGTLFFGGPKATYLQKVTVDVISNANCQQSLGTGTTVAPTQMCTFRLGKDSCQDDSGGPVVYIEPQSGFYYLIGIISFGQLCASRTPSINTRLTTHMQWILANTAGETFCNK